MYGHGAAESSPLWLWEHDEIGRSVRYPRPRRQGGEVPRSPPRGAGWICCVPLAEYCVAMHTCWFLDIGPSSGSIREPTRFEPKNGRDWRCMVATWAKQGSRWVIPDFGADGETTRKRCQHVCAAISKGKLAAYFHIKVRGSLSYVIKSALLESWAEECCK